MILYRYRLAISLVLSVVLAAPSHSQTNSEHVDEIYKCRPLSALYLQDDGTFGKSIASDGTALGYMDIIVDTATGAMRFGSVVRQWRIVQKGSSVNDFVAAAGPSLASNLEDYVRVRAWSSKEKVTFFLVSLTRVMTGTCVAVR